MPRQKRPPSPTYSRELLRRLAPVFTAPVHFCATPFARHARRLELRGSVLLLFAPSTSSTSLADARLVRPLSASAPPAPHAATAVALPGVARRLWFSSRRARDTFLSAAARACAAAAPDRLRGLYTVERLLGRGASAAVYRVVRRRDGRRLALKAVPKAYAFASDAQLDNVVGERVALAEAARRDARFVVRLVDAFETPSHLCFVTELAERGDLGEYIRRKGGKLREEEAKTVFAELVLALEEAHEMGFLYRDMKPANVLVGADGHVKLGDLGLAKRVEKRVEEDQSGSESEEGRAWRLVGRSESFVGTRKFMAPEVVRAGRGRGYGASADVWALGVTLYLMVTGRYPVGGRVPKGDWRALAEAIREEEVAFPEGSVGELLEGMLDRDALDRWDLGEVKRSEWLGDVDWEAVGEGRGLEAEGEVTEVGETATEIEDAGTGLDNMSLLGFGYVA